MCSCIWYAIYRTADTHSINIDRNRYTKTSDYFLFLSLARSFSLEIHLVIRCNRLSVINMCNRTHTFNVNYRVIFLDMCFTVSVHVRNFIFFLRGKQLNISLLLVWYAHEFGDTNLIMNCFSVELPNGFNKTWLLFHVRTLLWIQMKTKFEFEAVISWSKVDFKMKINKEDNTHVKSFFKMQYERCSSNKNIKINNDKTTSTTTKTTNKQHVKHDNLFIFSHSFNLHVFNILCVYASASVCLCVRVCSYPCVVPIPLSGHVSRSPFDRHTKIKKMKKYELLNANLFLSQNCSYPAAFLWIFFPFF